MTSLKVISQTKHNIVKSLVRLAPSSLGYAARLNILIKPCEVKPNSKYPIVATFADTDKPREMC